MRYFEASETSHLLPQWLNWRPFFFSFPPSASRLTLVRSQGNCFRSSRTNLKCQQRRCDDSAKWHYWSCDLSLSLYYKCCRKLFHPPLQTPDMRNAFRGQEIYSHVLEDLTQFAGGKLPRILCEPSVVASLGIRTLDRGIPGWQDAKPHLISSPLRVLMFWAKLRELLDRILDSTSFAPAFVVSSSQYTISSIRIVLRGPFLTSPSIHKFQCLPSPNLIHNQ